MALESLRRYLLETEFADYNLADVDNYVLIQAERDIDNAVANFYQGSLAKFFLGTEIQDNVTLTTTTATLGNAQPSDNFYSYTVLEVMTGANASKKIAIQSNASNVLTFFDTQAGLSGNVSVRVYQSGKFPMYRDTESLTNAFYKTIRQEIKQAIAEQYRFRLANPDLFANQTKVQSSYSTSASSWSESFATGKNGVDRISIRDLTAPIAMQILEEAGLTIQTI